MQKKPTILKDSTQERYQSALPLYFKHVRMSGPIPSHIQDIGCCWSWCGSIDEHGYARIWIKTTFVKAYRVSWIFHRGEIPDGKCVLHKCDNPQCTKPEHLFLGTRADNVYDMVLKNRHGTARGEASGMAKLTWDSVTEIRAINPHGRKQVTFVASAYGVHWSQVYRILRADNNCWKK